MTIPSFFNPKNAEIWGYDPNLTLVTEQAFADRDSQGITLAARDTVRIALLGIDLQRDFCHSNGTLYVGGRSGRGAIDDNVRLAQFVYRNAGLITRIDCTLDTHFPWQNFLSSFWQTADGRPVKEHTEVTILDGEICNTVVGTNDVIHRGIVPRPEVAAMYFNGNYTWLVNETRHYIEELAKTGKYTLYLWPFHCQLGTTGHALMGVIAEARHYHAILRGSAGHLEIKGGSPITENYSVFAPEVLLSHDGRPIGQRNVKFLEILLSHDIVIVAGQAASHCVRSSLDDILEYVNTQNPALAKRLYVLSDGMSAVTVPNPAGGFYADFTPQAEQALNNWAAHGCHVVESTTDMMDWPGVGDLFKRW